MGTSRFTSASSSSSSRLYECSTSTMETSRFATVSSPFLCHSNELREINVNWNGGVAKDVAPPLQGFVVHYGVMHLPIHVCRLTQSRLVCDTSLAPVKPAGFIDIPMRCNCIY